MDQVDDAGNNGNRRRKVFANNADNDELDGKAPDCCIKSVPHASRDTERVKPSKKFSKYTASIRSISSRSWLNLGWVSETSNDRPSI